MRYQSTFVKLLVCILMIAGCGEAPKSKAKSPLIVDKKELECKRKNWNRVPKKEGYVMDVVSKQEYKPASK